MTFNDYLSHLQTLYKTGHAREHAYRGDLATLLHSILPDIVVTNEPARVSCGAPDYVLTRKDIPVGYIEAKDIGIDLQSKSLKEQFDRYKLGLANLIFTDYLEFHFYKEGVFVTKVSIAKLEDGADGKKHIIPIPENFDIFTALIKNFSETVTQSVKSPTKLAQMMAGKAKLMANIIFNALEQDDLQVSRSGLQSQMSSFRQMLIHDIDNKAFADIYSQTIAYGMFAARYHDPTLPTFSRVEAAQLIPKSNPFLRKLFQDIAGYDLDDRLVWIVDELVNIFLASDVATIMKNFGRTTKQEDPVVHFYETFLAEYNPALRKARGVWYTPQPVVNFIVRAVDDILKTEFNLPQGLADTSKIKIKRKGITQTGKGANSKIVEVETEEEVHKVQILDPATGTGTFLAEVVRHIHKKFEGQQGIWSKYVTKDLIPRLNGFELLMASYAMAHLKMDMLLTETGYKPTDDQRFRIFLTNSLEEAHPDTSTLFSSWLSDEAEQANAVKRDAPVMCVIGNPPYSGESSNKGEWIMRLMEDYKKEPGGKEKLKERNPKALNDDYLKFLRFAQHFIEKNQSGIIGFINPHGFIDSPIYRGLRWNLVKTFDKIYILNLHGNAKKMEVAKDGSPDVNVFDIMQGVSINLFIKSVKGCSANLAKVYYFDLLGKREFKYNFLSENSIDSITFSEVNAKSPNYYFGPENVEGKEIYYDGFPVKDFFVHNSSGVKTHDDLNLVASEKQKLEDQVTTKYKTFTAEKISKYSYRPFDNGFIYYDSNILGRAREKTIFHLRYPNIALLLVGQPQAANPTYFDCAFLTKTLTDTNLFRRGGPLNFPLYTYQLNLDQQNILETGNPRTPNLNPKIIAEIEQKLKLTFVPEKEDGNVCFATNNAELRDEYKSVFAPIDLLDYIYAVLHSPAYREKYKEFLKIDFPRVPYPEDQTEFWRLVKLGGELRQIHLLESATVDKYITQYPEDGDNIVAKPLYKDGNVFINDTQYFANVPKIAWNLYIGGYQPAQKWLKDRKGRELSYEDILHYQKIIVALNETARLMDEIG